MVDNCYGELVEEKEPGHVGANIIVGSLMKNLGGGVAATGGYIAGNEDLVGMVAERLTAPGIGKDLGANFNLNNSFFNIRSIARHEQFSTKFDIFISFTIYIML